MHSFLTPALDRSE